MIQMEDSTICQRFRSHWTFQYSRAKSALHNSHSLAQCRVTEVGLMLEFKFVAGCK